MMQLQLDHACRGFPLPQHAVYRVACVQTIAVLVSSSAFGVLAGGSKPALLETGASIQVCAWNG